MGILASEIKHNNKTHLTGLCEVFFISWGEISLANTGRAWSLWVSDGCWGHSYSYSPFQTPAGRWTKAISSSRAILFTSANGRKWHLHLGKNIINVHSCGSSGSLVIRQVRWVCVGTGWRSSRASPVYPGDLGEVIEVDLSPKLKVPVITQSSISHLQSQSLHSETRPDIFAAFNRRWLGFSRSKGGSWPLGSIFYNI